MPAPSGTHKRAARNELLEALREYSMEETGRDRLIRACGPLWNATERAPIMVVAAVAGVLQDMPKRRTYSMLVRALRRQLEAEVQGQTFTPHGRRRILSRGD